MMSNQPKQQQQEQPEQKALTPDELRQNMLAQLDASKQALQELSDEELEEVAGGFSIHFLKQALHATEEFAGPIARVSIEMARR